MAKPTYEVDVAPDKALWGPPGTGKTTALMDDMAQLLEDGYRPTDIGGFTYRRNMAAEFVERAEEVVGSVPDRHWYRTTHSACFRLLDVDTDDVVDNDTFRDFCGIHGYTATNKGIEDDVDDDSPWAATLTGGKDAEGEVLMKIRSYCINSGVGTENWRSAPLTREERMLMSDALVARFNAEYEDWKANQGLVDYDDMLLNVVEQGLAPPIDVLMEDEFQDKTPLQVAVYNVWADAADEVYVAGDPYQAIYAYQGTDPAFMRDAFDKADEATVLRTSWRLGPEVADVARKILSKHYDVPEIEPTGEAEVERLPWDEYETAVRRHEHDETFHLARANYHLTHVAGVLSDVGVPFRSERRRWSERQLDLYNGVAKMVRAIEETPALTQPDFDLTQGEMKRVANALPAAALTGKKKVVDEAIEAGATMNEIVNKANLGPVISGNPFAEIKKRSSSTLVGSQVGPAGIRSRLETAFDSRDGEPIGEINHEMSTIHGAKGREADVVFLLDASTPAIEDGADPLDEVRVFYVGCTRARKKLYVVNCPWSKRTTHTLPLGL